MQQQHIGHCFAVKGSRKTNGHLEGLVARGVRGFVFNVSRLEVIIEEKQCKRNSPGVVESNLLQD